MPIHKTHDRRWRLKLLIILGVMVFGASVYYVMHAAQLRNEFSLRRNSIERFPDVASELLSPQQAKIVSILRTEFAAQSPGTKYSQGVTEPWCADFVSWVMNQADAPFTNPHSGSWRIPGTMTLRDYLIQLGNWRAYGDNYVPQIGDIAIYDGNGPHGQHTNFVIEYTDGKLTTIGGNEAGEIRLQQHRLDDDLQVIGFGSL